MTDVPSPRELVRAYRTVKRLQRAVYDHRDWQGPDGEKVWDGLVEAHRMVAIATSGLGQDDPKYREAWERMLEL